MREYYLTHRDTYEKLDATRRSHTRNALHLAQLDTSLMDALQLTGGTISVRIDRLERDGIVERLPDPHDQRGVLVRLTKAGERLFDQVAALHLANEDRLLSALNAQVLSTYGKWKSFSKKKVKKRS